MRSTTCGFDKHTSRALPHAVVRIVIMSSSARSHGPSREVVAQLLRLPVDRRAAHRVGYLLARRPVIFTCVPYP